jgi:hypothetical protein
LDVPGAWKGLPQGMVWKDLCPGPAQTSSSQIGQVGVGMLLELQYQCQHNPRKYEDGLPKIQKIHYKPTTRSTKSSFEHLYSKEFSEAQ